MAVLSTNLRRVPQWSRVLALLTVALALPILIAALASTSSASAAPPPFVSCSPSSDSAYEQESWIPVSCVLREAAQSREVGFAVSIYSGGATGIPLRHARHVYVQQQVGEDRQHVDSIIQIPASARPGSGIDLVIGLWSATGRSLGYVEVPIEVTESAHDGNAGILQQQSTPHAEAPNHLTEICSATERKSGPGVGAVIVRSTTTTMGAAFGAGVGTATGCGVGGGLGSIVPGVGTAIGCAIGGTIGGIGGAITGGYTGYRIGEGMTD